MTRRFNGVRLRAAAVGILAVLLVGTMAAPARADDYPTWQDVQNAKANQATAQAEVTRIQGLVANLTTRVAQTQADATRAGDEFHQAQAEFDQADMKTRQLRQQASALKQKSESSAAQAGRLAAELYRSGGGHLTANLLLTGERSGADASRMLDNLAAASKVVENTTAVYRRADQARNTADAAAAQASVVRTQRERLRTVADAALQNAVTAAQAAESALKTQRELSVVLDAQLAALGDKTTATVAGYQKGVEVRAAAVAAAARAAAAAARAAAAGAVGGQGWARPAYGPITDGFGPRVSPCSGCTSWHMGADIGAACSSTIYAAHDGTVSYAGRNGGYGNYVQLQHEGGISTGYGHIVGGGILVGVGQRVRAGQPIAKVGSTGNSTGCHLHYEVRINSSATDPIAFMSQRGAPLG